MIFITCDCNVLIVSMLLRTLCAFFIQHILELWSLKISAQIVQLSGNIGHNMSSLFFSYFNWTSYILGYFKLCVVYYRVYWVTGLGVMLSFKVYSLVKLCLFAEELFINFITFSVSHQVHMLWWSVDGIIIWNTKQSFLYQFVFFTTADS